MKITDLDPLAMPALLRVHSGYTDDTPDVERLRGSPGPMGALGNVSINDIEAGAKRAVDRLVRNFPAKPKVAVEVEPAPHGATNDEFDRAIETNPNVIVRIRCASKVLADFEGKLKVVDLTPLGSLYRLKPHYSWVKFLKFGELEFPWYKIDSIHGLGSRRQLVYLKSTL